MGPTVQATYTKPFKFTYYINIAQVICYSYSKRFRDLRHCKNIAKSKKIPAKVKISRASAVVFAHVYLYAYLYLLLLSFSFHITPAPVDVRKTSNSSSSAFVFLLCIDSGSAPFSTYFYLYFLPMSTLSSYLLFHLSACSDTLLKLSLPLRPMTLPTYP